MNDKPTNSLDLDQISLTQALQDFEVANARVIDLTKRLTTMNNELVLKTTELQQVKSLNRRLESELEEMRGSTAYRSAAFAGRAARAVRSRLGK